MPEVIVIAHNIRSTHNVGAIFRTADGFGISRLILSGYTPYPRIADDPRLPYIADKLTKQIHKTALGAEKTVPFEQCDTLNLAELKAQGYRIAALEQAPNSISLKNYNTPDKVALLLGEEVEGIASELLTQCDDILEIPMHGSKESFNVSVAAGIAMYHMSSK